MGKKPITEKDHRNYSEGSYDLTHQDTVDKKLVHQYLEDQAAEDFPDTPKTFTDPERFVTNEVQESTNAGDVPSWDSEEHIWSAAKAHKVSDAFETRIFKRGLCDVMRYVKTAANSGQYECTVYSDNIASDANIDDIIHSLAARGYTVKKFEQYSGWYVKISW